MLTEAVRRRRTGDLGAAASRLARRAGRALDPREIACDQPTADVAPVADVGDENAVGQAIGALARRRDRRAGPVTTMVQP